MSVHRMRASGLEFVPICERDRAPILEPISKFEKAERVTTPAWVLSINPNVPIELSRRVVNKFEKSRKAAIEWKEERKYSRKPIEQLAILLLMNDFYHRVFSLIAESKAEKFICNIRALLSEYNLLLDKAKRRGRVEGSIYLLPVFVRLLEMGYKQHELTG